MDRATADHHKMILNDFLKIRRNLNAVNIRTPLYLAMAIAKCHYLATENDGTKLDIE